MKITVRYISDINGISTVAFLVEDKLISIISAKCEVMDAGLIELRERLKKYGEGEALA